MFKEDLMLLTRQNIDRWNHDLKNATPQQIIKYFSEKYGNKISFASSMGLEDQVITQMIATSTPELEIFTLDTGRLFQETYDLIQKTNSRYKINIRIYFPNAEEVENMVSKKGINLFYESIENRKLCCHIRKIRPLQRALKGKSAWITGIRNEQANTRKDSKMIEWDEANSIIKINPLINWTEEQVLAYIKEHNIPYNILHNKGFKSIGCQPCTRAIESGEDSRAGRWWWENAGHKECGLHKR